MSRRGLNSLITRSPDGGLLFIQKRAGLFSPARSYKPTSAIGVDTLFYFSQMRESSFGMFRGDIGVARFPMLNGFFQMLNPFVQMRVFASHLSILQRLFRMCHEHLSMTLVAMVHRFLRVHDGFPDVTGGGRLGVQHGHTHERSKRNQ